jgi:uncharacterized membrane protein
MAKIRILLVGESWVSKTIHVKGFDHFSAAEYQTGLAGLNKALAKSDIELIHIPRHLAAADFPQTRETLARYDVLVVSDVGANTLLLHPDTFLRGKRTPNRLRLIADWVAEGGGFAMIGGYYSFQGIYGAARYKGTPLEAILPVNMLAVDDRIETPEGFTPHVVVEHPILAGIEGEWPYLLGLNETEMKSGRALIMTAGAGSGAKPLLAVGEHGAGRTLAWTSDIGPHWLPESFVEWPGYGVLWRQAFAWLARRL